MGHISKLFFAVVENFTRVFCAGAVNQRTGKNMGGKQNLFFYI